MYIEENCLYVTGAYSRPTGYGPPFGVLYFENTIEGNISISTLNEAGGNKYLAKMDLVTNNWIWQRNIDEGNNLCVANGDIYVYNTSGNAHLDKYNVSTGTISYSGDLRNMLLIRLYPTIGNKLHFNGRNIANSYSPIYGTITPDLLVSEFYPFPSNSDNTSNDWLGNIYCYSSTTFFKSGYPNPYILREETSPINYNLCYPNVQYEKTVSFVNIGNAALSINGFQFTNNTPGLSAEVVSGSPANSGDSIMIKIILNANTVGAFSDTLLVNSNSPYVPSYKIAVSGYVSAVPPEIPTNVKISILGSDAQISWEAVTQSILGHPLTPDYYFVYFNGWEDIEGPFYFLGRSFTTQYTHLDVGLGAEHMLYRVKAIKLYRDSNRAGTNDLESYLTEHLQVGMSEAEVAEILKALE